MQFMTLMIGDSMFSTDNSLRGDWQIMPRQQMYLQRIPFSFNLFGTGFIVKLSEDTHKCSPQRKIYFIAVFIFCKQTLNRECREKVGFAYYNSSRL